MGSHVIRKIGLGLLIGTFAFGITTYANPNLDTYKTITREGVILKYAPSKDALDTIELKKDEEIKIGEQIGDYVEVFLDYGMIAYIEASDLEEEIEAEPEVSRADQVIEFAMQYVGNPYRYGGSSLTNGADCSGFTSQVFKNFDISIPRVSRDQYALAGTKVNKVDLQAGDLVFYGYKGRVNHVAIYIGDHKIIHAGTAKTGIHVSPFQQRGMAPYIGAKRLIQ